MVHIRSKLGKCQNSGLQDKSKNGFWQQIIMVNGSKEIGKSDMVTDALPPLAIPPNIIPSKTIDFALYVLPNSSPIMEAC